MRLYEQALPNDACTFWQRQQFRAANDEGFGASPFSMMTADQAEAYESKRGAEDDSDPPCARCSCCNPPLDKADVLYWRNRGAEDARNGRHALFRSTKAHGIVYDGGDNPPDDFDVEQAGRAYLSGFDEEA